MIGGLSIDVGWERLAEGDPEERATFAELRIGTPEVALTEGHDAFVNRLRPGPLVSAYHAAEWFAWNWWRLRWEPKTRRQGWSFAHDMATIGQGYVWPNITIRSDGRRIALIARSSRRRDAKPFRYMMDRTLVVGAGAFEAAVDGFVNEVIARLRGEGIGDSNLDRVWHDVLSERADHSMTLRRRMEALLGVEPDDADEAALNALVTDASAVGADAVAELAAEEGTTGKRHTVANLREVADREGVATEARDAVNLRETSFAQAMSSMPAWRIGVDAASALRRQEGLGTAPIGNARLEQMAGAASGVVGRSGSRSDISFVLGGDGLSRLVLRSSWETGRRFDLARLIGDRIALPGPDKLKPATRTYTYRQKLQRAFAGEFLCPFEAAEDILRGEYSREAIEDVARHFDVSEYTIRTQLMNHRRIERDDFGQDEELADAA